MVPKLTWASGQVCTYLPGQREEARGREGDRRLDGDRRTGVARKLEQAHRGGPDWCRHPTWSHTPTAQGDARALASPAQQSSVYRPRP